MTAAYTWDDLARVIELAARDGHHIPGTDYEWKHDYIPLTHSAAASHFGGKVPKGWSAPSGGKSEPQGRIRRDASESDVLAALKAGQASGVKSGEAPAAGHTAATTIVRFNNGTTMVRKQFSGGEVREIPKEVLASKISKIVGAGAPTVVRDPENEDVIWQPYVDAKTPFQRLFEEVPGANQFPKTGPLAVDPHIESAAGKKIGMLDRIIGNSDRHHENWLVQDGPVPIDHGGSFYKGFATDPSSYFSLAHPLTKQDAAALPGIRAKIAAMNLSDPQERNLREIALDNIDAMIEAAK